jgi:hypothetical protein
MKKVKAWALILWGPLAVFVAGFCALGWRKGLMALGFSCLIGAFVYVVGRSLMKGMADLGVAQAKSVWHCNLCAGEDIGKPWPPKTEHPDRAAGESGR